MAQVDVAEGSRDHINGTDGLETLRRPATKSSKSILTLFGGDRQAKQLFSSLGKRKSPGADDLSEQALPNGISTTEIVPTHSLNDGDDTKSPTIRETFPPGSNLAPLNAPRPSKHTTSRSGPVSWYTPSIISRKTVDRRTFATQPLPTGHWITYNAPPAPRQHSPETKRKQRDRALSFGEAQSPTNDESSAAHNQAKDDALFKSVYSSFAPDRDDSVAVVAAQEKNQIWYSRYGEDAYQDLLDFKDQILYGDSYDGGEEEEEEEEIINEEEIKEAIETWVPSESEINEPFLNTTEESSEDEATQALAEISDLLETLNSHQRIRYESLPVAARTSTGSIPTTAGSSAQQPGASSSELEVYQTLQKRLASIVSTLSPYLLSKLDGDKLGALNISTKIQVEGKNQKGTLLEDEISIKARAAARTPVPAPVTQTPGSFTGARGVGGYQAPVHTPSSQFPRPTYGAPGSVTRPGMPQSYSSNHYASRPPPAGYSSGGPRQSYTPQGSYASQRPASYTERFANGATQYSTPQTYNNYTNASYRSQGQQASSYNAQYATPQTRAPASAAAHLQAYRATQSEYQQRVSAPSQGYGYGNAPVGAATSPQPSPQNRLSFPAQGHSPNPQRPQPHNQLSPNHTSRSPQPQTNGVPASSGGQMSPDDQATLMNRQKAQMAEAVQQMRQASGTPQPVIPNGGSQNGTPHRQPSHG